MFREDVAFVSHTFDNILLVFDNGWVRRIAHSYPTSPRTLEELSLPADPFLLFKMLTVLPFVPENLITTAWRQVFVPENLITTAWRQVFVPENLITTAWRQVFVPENLITTAWRQVFVPENLITTAWRQVRLTLPQDMATFINYYERTWVGTTHADPLFPHSRWNQNEATALLLPRSSNIAEGWHHGFNAMMSCSNPSIWKFLQCLKNEQNITDVKMTKLMIRESPEPRSAKWRKYDEKLQAVIQKFDSYPTILDFLKCASCLM